MLRRLERPSIVAAALLLLLAGASSIAAESLPPHDPTMRRNAATAAGTDHAMPAPGGVFDPSPPASRPIIAASVTFAVAYGPEPYQLLDLHHPARHADTRAPVIVYAHAGGWIAGTRQDVPAWVRQLADHAGAVIATVDYALASGDQPQHWPTPIHDLDRAIRWIKANAVPIGADPNRLVVAGVSAGGHLAALIGADPVHHHAPDLPPALATVDPTPAGIISVVGITDLVTFPDAGGWAPHLAAALMDCPDRDPRRCDPAALMAASPVRRVSLAATPAFIVHGRFDDLVDPATQHHPLVDAWRRVQPDPTYLRPHVIDGDHNLHDTAMPVTDLHDWIDTLLGSARLPH